jgi:DNA-damage-inducible protein J
MATKVHNIRIDEDVKQSATTVFSSLGLTLSDAVNVFLRKAIMANGFPFEVKNNYTPNETTLEAFCETDEKIKNGSHRCIKSVDELFSSMRSEDENENA